ncbi:trafficking protein particle complex subunit 10 [Callorhinchus milii]|uniref:trafficking protein particle complex subunit 10 n=1 Tax=Callorhinchus milii TaxID=7868 RepID=UPI001C3FA57F|nr:trafficking protein particle complex subunit 10 [Callorhinchus milii]
MASEEKPVVYTMENRPIVTCGGDQSLFSSIYQTLVQQLPKEAVEWRRSYGRPPKMINLEANFVAFKEDLLPKEGSKALLTFPFLHIFWTDCCESEVYKASTKEEITRWQSMLRAYNSPDWLVVLVENENRKKKQPIALPRTSIIDKIRNDFCNKQSDRCVVLTDPLRDSSKTQESWASFVAKLRMLLLMSFTRNLGRFEDDMRALREKRTHPSWSFCHYFMVQEELAFVFEMLQQYEDALVQYDELDALFTQYVLNFGAGDTADWLSSFRRPVSSWVGLALWRPIDMGKREAVQTGQASLLDLRSYLFSRQCTLLFFLQRPWEVAHRALELLHNSVLELRMLEIQMPVGAVDCWVYISCLEVLQRIETFCDTNQNDSFAAYAAGLRAYAREKLQGLGSLCGLMSPNGPDSEELNRTVDLLAGLRDDDEDSPSNINNPGKKLREALSSMEAYEKHYMELSEIAMGTYKHIGRIRSARLIGTDLAEYHMRKGEPQKAEAFLYDALKTYRDEGWTLPVTHTRKQIATCQKQLGNTTKYLEMCSLLASDLNLPVDERESYFKEILGSSGAEDHGEFRREILLPLEPVLQLSSVRFTPASALVNLNGTLVLQLVLVSRLPASANSTAISIALAHEPRPGPAAAAATTGANGGTPRYPDGRVVFPGNAATDLPVRRQLPALIDVCELREKGPQADAPLASSGVVCRNSHMLLRRQDSNTSSGRGADVTREEASRSLRATGVQLRPGKNTVTLSAVVTEPGSFTLRQLCVQLGCVHLLSRRLYPPLQYDVYSQEPQLNLLPSHEPLLAGVPQELTVTVNTGCYSVRGGDALQLSLPAGLLILNSGKNTARISTDTGAHRERQPPRHACYHTLRFSLRVACALPLAAAGGADGQNGAPVDKVESRKAGGGAVVEADVLDQKISIDSPWSIYSTIVPLAFKVPFRTRHSLLTAGERKFVQVCLSNTTEVAFVLRDHHLGDVTTPDGDGGCQSAQLKPLNPLSHNVVLGGQNMWFIWELLPTSPAAPLRCHFSVGFWPEEGAPGNPSAGHPSPDSPLEDVDNSAPGGPPGPTTTAASAEPSRHRYEFTLSDFKVSHTVPYAPQTLYMVLSEVRPPTGFDACRMGELCSLDVSITRQLFYQVADNCSNWAVCGKSSGLVQPAPGPGTTHSLQLQLMPLFAGKLPLPDVRLARLLPSQDAPGPPSLHPDNGEASPDANTTVGTPFLLPLVPRLQQFAAGQVYHASRAAQVLVLPAHDHSLLDVTAP